MPIDVDKIVADLQRSRKYGHLCSRTLERMAGWAAARGTSTRDAAKRARRKLHQVYGAYLQQWDPASATSALDALGADPDTTSLQAACRQVLPLHASTRERLGALETVYPAIFAVTGRPDSLLDLGCGLNPFALPWMDLPAGARYLAWEIDHRIVSLIGRLLTIAGVAGSAECRDVLAELAGPPPEPVDLVVLLKMLPCLEQQEPGCSRRVIEWAPSRFVAVSHPLRSLGGKGKNMPAHYAAAMRAVVAGTPWRLHEIPCKAELLHVVDKTPSARRPGGNDQ